MAKRVFYSFHYKPDCFRAGQVRNMGVVEGNKPATDNDWESIKKSGDEAIKRWINRQLDGKSCGIVLIGASTAGRKWIKYEIERAWNEKKGLLGIYIHRLKNLEGETATKGSNPFDGFTLCEGKKQLSSIVNAYNPPYTDSKDVYKFIRDNLEKWIEDAISIRDNFSC